MQQATKRPRIKDPEVTRVGQLSLAEILETNGFGAIDDGEVVITTFPNSAIRHRRRFSASNNDAPKFETAESFSVWVNKRMGDLTHAIGGSVYWKKVGADGKSKLHLCFAQYHFNFG